MMNILKAVLLGSLRIMLMASLKAGLCIYAFFLTDTSLASAGDHYADYAVQDGHRDMGGDSDSRAAGMSEAH